MSIFHANSLEALNDFAKRSDQLGIMERDVPQEAEVFFQRLMSTPFKTMGKVYKESALEDVRSILQDTISDEMRGNSFYQVWLTDMAKVCEVFCNIQNSKAISFWLGSERGCRRYHIDNVPLRLLVTYAGKGTEWLPDEAADLDAYRNGEPNEKIVRDRSALQYMNQWDISIFRGDSGGLLHRTPDAALNGPSILMRLDHAAFWDNVLNHREQSKTPHLGLL